MPIERNFKLYLNAGRSIPLVINANQYDSGETWLFTLYTESGEVYTPSSGAIIGIKADGHVIDNAATVDSRGRVVVTETEQMTAAPGKSVFELSIDDNSHGTADFMVLVEPKPSDGGILSDSDLSLLQQAIDSTSPEAIAEGVSDWMDDHLAPSQWVIDDTLTVQGAAADAKKTGDEITDLKSAIESGGGGMTDDFKAALDTLVNHIGAWTDGNAQQYISALHNAMYPPANLSYITAVYTQSGTVLDTDTLDDLRADLVVTAYYSDNTSAVVTAYTLSGTLTAGTSTITASYGGKSATFNVTVTNDEQWTYTWEYTDGLPENNGLTKTSNGTVSISMESNGLRISIAENDNNDVKYQYNNNVTTKHTRIVYEVGLIPVALSTVNGRGIRMNTGIGGTGNNAAFGTQLALNVNGIQYLGEASGWSLLTANTLNLNVENKIKIDQIDGSADIYVNGALVGTITSFRERVGFPALQFRNVNETIFRSFKVRCID